MADPDEYIGREDPEKRDKRFSGPFARLRIGIRVREQRPAHCRCIRHHMRNQTIIPRLTGWTADSHPRCA